MSTILKKNTDFGLYGIDSIYFIILWLYNLDGPIYSAKFLESVLIVNILSKQIDIW